jgi:hypothetical protein
LHVQACEQFACHDPNCGRFASRGRLRSDAVHSSCAMLRRINAN